MSSESKNLVEVSSMLRDNYKFRIIDSLVGTTTHYPRRTTETIWRKALPVVSSTGGERRCLRLPMECSVAMEATQRKLRLGVSVLVWVLARWTSTFFTGRRVAGNPQKMNTGQASSSSSSSTKYNPIHICRKSKRQSQCVIIL